MDTESFIVYIKSDDIYKNIGEDVEIRSDTSNYELDRPFVGLGVKAYSYLIVDGSKIKKQKAQKSVL